MALDGTRTLRGALAGAAAAAVWAAQQPLDKRVLRRRLRRRRAARQGRHARARVAAGRARRPPRQRRGVRRALRQRRPEPARPARRVGSVAGLAEYFATWPATPLLDRVHPAADDFRALWGNPRALAQATWRHLLFGFVLGELERRLNPPEDEPGADRRRRRRVQRARLRRAPRHRRAGLSARARVLDHRARPASRAPTSRAPARPRATRCWTCRARAGCASTCSTPTPCAPPSATRRPTSCTTSRPGRTSASRGGCPRPTCATTPR